MRCLECGRAIDEDARFCAGCGTPVDGSRRGVDGQEPRPVAPAPRDGIRERKVATLLFADIVGFTSIAEAHDPEMVSALTADVFARLARETRRYEGSVEKFAGDAMLAVFGVPAAHEDDPQRAIRAALGMQASMDEMRASADERQPRLELRIGIDTGEVLVDRARAANERDLFVTGDAVNTAARLEVAAEPGSILVGAATHAATRDAVDYEALPSLDLKGKAGPVDAWRVVGLRPGGADRRALDLDTPLVGRDDELRRLRQAVEQVALEGRPQLVTILGEAGVGKSRLAWELQQYLAGRAPGFHWRRGRCIAFADRSYGPIAEVFKAEAGIADDDAPEVVREKVQGRLAELGLGNEPQLREAIGSVLGVGDGVERPRGELFEAWGLYFATLAATMPVVLVVEDIHWADDDVLAFLDFLARWGEGPMAIVCLARPELLERQMGWGRGLPSATSIALDALDEAASTALVDNLLDGDLPPELRAHIVERAEGNPLFAEETLRMLVDRGALRFSHGAWGLAAPLAEVEIPASIQAVLAARLDTLPVAEKRVAQEAAVIGRIFWDTPVAELSDVDDLAVGESLGRLQSKGLIVPREPSSLAGANEFAFRHVLIRDVAYESLPKRDRAAIHERTATWLEERLAGRMEEFAELIASHLSAAVDYEEVFAASGSAELRSTREHTYAAAQRAARRASSLGLVERACRWMRRAIDLAYALELSPREVARLADEDAASHGHMTQRPDHVPIIARAVDELEQLRGLTTDDEQLLARLRCALAAAHIGAGDLETGRAVARVGIARLGSSQPTPGGARLHHALGFSYSRAGSYVEAVSALRTALSMAAACADARTERWALHDLAGCTDQGADLDEAIDLIERSYRLALDAGDRALTWRCRHNLAMLRFEHADPLAPILELAREALRQARFENEGRLHTGNAWSVALYAWEMGRLDEALAVTTELLAASMAEDLYLGGIFGFRALVFRGLGRVDEAERDEAAHDAADGEPYHDDVWADIFERGWADWARDPFSTPVNLEAMLDRADLGTGTDLGLGPMGKPELLHTIARLALRLGDEALLEGVITRYHALGESWMTPILRLRHSMDGYLAGDAGISLEEPAASLEENGYALASLDLWMDAALLAHRAGRESGAGDRAQSIIDRTGLHPLIGPLPETRWQSTDGERGRSP